MSDERKSVYAPAGADSKFGITEKEWIWISELDTLQKKETENQRLKPEPKAYLQLSPNPTAKPIPKLHIIRQIKYQSKKRPIACLLKKQRPSRILSA